MKISYLMDKRSATGLLVFFLSVCLFSQLNLPQTSLANGGEKDVTKIPSLEETIKIALRHNPGEPPNEIIYAVKENYHMLQLKNDQLDISEEVQEHFETAVEKAEEKMESDDADITQSQITKLKLGLAGAISDIIKHNSASQKARLSLGKLMGAALPADAELTDDNLVQIKTPYKSIEEYLKLQEKESNSSGEPGKLNKRISGEKMHLLQEALIELDEKRKLTSLARKNRRMTRALLVTEVANYDFGIGDGGDLFEALIIYTRLLNGFHKSVYGFNLGVANLDKIYSE